MDYKINAHVTVEQLEKSIECLKCAIKCARANGQRESNAIFAVEKATRELMSTTESEYQSVFMRATILQLAELNGDLHSRCEHQRYIADRCEFLIEWLFDQIDDREYEQQHCA